MFTGLIEEVGVIEKVLPQGEGVTLIIKTKMAKELVHGESVSTNGVCLTVNALTGDTFSADVMPETLRRSNLSLVSSGSEVNLERALRIGDRLGGHFVTGHSDGMGTIVAIKKEGNATWITIEPEKEFMSLLVMKGSVAIDGISLTVANVSKKQFQVSIIPVTKEETTLLKRHLGEKVNLEGDYIGKYVRRMLQSQEEEKPAHVTLDFLKENGFA